MGKRAHEILALPDIGLQGGDFFLHRIGHFVKAAAQCFDLIAGVQAGAAGIVAVGDLGAGGSQGAQRAGHAAGKHGGDGSPCGQHSGFQQQKAAQRGIAPAVEIGQVVGGGQLQPALQAAGIGGLHTSVGQAAHFHRAVGQQVAAAHNADAVAPQGRGQGEVGQQFGEGSIIQAFAPALAVHYFALQ